MLSGYHFTAEHSTTVLPSEFSYEWLAEWIELSLSRMLRATVSRPVCHGINHPSGAYNQILLLSDNCGFVGLGRPLWREDGSAVFNCYWLSPAQSFSDPSPVELAIIYYCLRFETSLLVASYDSQGYGGGIRRRLRCLSDESLEFTNPLPFITDTQP
jgi:hypothetical protein